MFERMSNAGKVPMPVLSVIVASAAVATAMLPAVASAQPVAQKFVESPPGTVSVFQRKTSGSLAIRRIASPQPWPHDVAGQTGGADRIATGAGTGARHGNRRPDRQPDARDGKPAVTHDPGLGYRYPFKVAMPGAQRIKSPTMPAARPRQSP